MRAPGGAEELRQLVGGSVRRVTTPKLPPPPPLSAQNRSGSRAGVDDAQRAVRGHHLRLEQARGRSAEALGEAAEAAALHESRHAHAGAAAALHVAAALRGDRVVDVDPHSARSRWSPPASAAPARAARGHEGFVQGHLVHRARPDEQRVGRVGGALVAVAAALHDSAQLVCAREVDRRGDVGAVRAPLPHRRSRRRPGVEPAGHLRCPPADRRGRTGLRMLASSSGRRRPRARCAGGEQRLHREQVAADRGVERCQAASSGQSGSDGRTRRRRADVAAAAPAGAAPAAAEPL